MRKLLYAACTAALLSGCTGSLIVPSGSTTIPTIQPIPGCTSKISGQYSVGAGFGGAVSVSGRYDMTCQGAPPSPSPAAIAPVPAF